MPKIPPKNCRKPAQKLCKTFPKISQITKVSKSVLNLILILLIMINCDFKIVLCIMTLLNQLLINELANIKKSCFADF